MEQDNKTFNRREEKNEAILQIKIGRTQYYIHSKSAGNKVVKDKVKEVLLRLAEDL